ncbi:arylsulfotransferase ASST [Chitinophaga niastensis]|uniref:Arylsulfotransferase ASST n=2 Tax=Chitinophaga niastensis TaxID=536980 RepID=A0A2P8HF19_CHINA|nr:arylsulfotransferase ASST [Chitinophaga niastensis]
MEPKAPMPYWLQEPFNTDSLQPALVSPVFKNGYILLSQRDEPGLLYLLNAKGTVVWYHQVKGTGFKTAHFTENKTLLCILGSKEYATSYGNEIMELSLKGDTLLHLKKGQQDFINNVHHEVLLSPGNNIVTLSTEERLVDLTARGGGPKDTVRSDGILVMDRKGNKVWQWSVFDALQPVNDKDIIRTRMDWMHANSLSFDKDGNYLISFYNNGQIWKLDAKTGKIIWKFGKGGDFKYPATAAFDMGHSVHINSENNLMLFDNGVSRQLSQTLAFKLNETTKEATVTIQSPIPSYLFNDRMGSAYLVDSNSILQCCSKRNTVILTDRKGTLLWRLRCSFIPYRAEFITKEQLPAFIVN